MTQNRTPNKAQTKRGAGNHAGQSHERDQLRGAFAGDQNESNLGRHGTKGKERKKQDHDQAEDIIESDDKI